MEPKPPAGTQPSPGQVVVGIDGSEGSVAALRWALANTPGDMAIRAVHAWRFPTTYGYVPDPGYESFEDEAADVLRRALERAWEAEGSQRPVEAVAVANELAQTVLCELSREAALLVVGRHGHHGLGRRLSGSVSRYCVDNAACPVVVVPGEQAGRARRPSPAEAA